MAQAPSQDVIQTRIQTALVLKQSLCPSRRAAGHLGTAAPSPGWGDRGSQEAGQGQVQTRPGPQRRSRPPASASGRDRQWCPARGLLPGHGEGVASVSPARRAPGTLRYGAAWGQGPEIQDPRARCPRERVSPGTPGATVRPASSSRHHLSWPFLPPPANGPFRRVTLGLRGRGTTERADNELMNCSASGPDPGASGLPAPTWHAGSGIVSAGVAQCPPPTALVPETTPGFAVFVKCLSATECPARGGVLTEGPCLCVDPGGRTEEGAAIRGSSWVSGTP